MYKIVTFALMIFVISACEPADRTPGMWLSGDLVNDAVSDWTFSNDYMEVQLETHPWYGIPFSVTVVAATTGDKLFVPSIYSAPAEFPGGKYWNGVIDKNPEVLIRIGDQLYPRSAQLIRDEVLFEEAFSALADKYDYWRAVKEGSAERPPFVLIQLADPS
ncbi:MAG: hypothetical protein ACI9FB_001941 [Candidatus Azotimanducaceae bacterium]|jgi:hypothetical protein